MCDGGGKDAGLGKRGPGATLSVRRGPPVWPGWRAGPPDGPLPPPPPPRPARDATSSGVPWRQRGLRVLGGAGWRLGLEWRASSEVCQQFATRSVRSDLCCDTWRIGAAKPARIFRWWATFSSACVASGDRAPRPGDRRETVVCIWITCRNLLSMMVGWYFLSSIFLFLFFNRWEI